MTAPLPSPEDVAAMRERHVETAELGGCFDVPWCKTCQDGWPCEVARLLALVDNQTLTLDHDKRHMDEQADRLLAVLAECDAADAKALASTARTFDGQPFPACIDVYRIRRAATGDGS